MHGSGDEEEKEEEGEKEEKVSREWKEGWRGRVTEKRAILIEVAWDVQGVEVEKG